MSNNFLFLRPNLALHSGDIGIHCIPVIISHNIKVNWGMQNVCTYIPLLNVP